MVQRRNYRFTHLPRILAVVAALSGTIDGWIEKFDFPGKMPNVINNPSHLSHVRLQIENLLLNYLRQGLRNIPVARLKTFEWRALANEMRLAEFFARHLKKEQRMTFCRQRRRILLVETPCFEVRIRLAGVSLRPLLFSVHRPLLA